MKKRFFRALALFSAAAFLFSGSAQAQSGTIGTAEYEIENPYSDVDWDTWTAYKACTHCHTTRSDGDCSPSEVVEKYYSLGYDILALTDHGTVSEDWTVKQDRLALYFWNTNTHKDVVSAERNDVIISGSDRGGRGMVQLPKGNEINTLTINKCHVNSYFADCGQGVAGLNTWPEEAVKLCQEAGGLCHLNHVGDWSGGEDDISTYDADFMARYAGLFLTYSGLVGMEVVNCYDEVTVHDRILYDKTLMITAPQGRNVFAFCEDDSHSLEFCGLNANVFIMPDSSVSSMRTCMETGAFFACSKYSYGEGYLGDYIGSGEFPTVTRIVADDEADTIHITAKNAQRLCMVSDGVILEEISVTEGQTVSFRLSEHQDELGSYVRFFLTGPGGICYLQPFLLNVTGQTLNADETGAIQGSCTVALPEVPGVTSADALVVCYCDRKFCGLVQTKVNLDEKGQVLQLDSLSFQTDPTGEISLQVFLLDEKDLHPITVPLKRTVRQIE